MPENAVMPVVIATFAARDPCHGELAMRRARSATLRPATARWAKFGAHRQAPAQTAPRRVWHVEGSVRAVPVRRHSAARPALPGLRREAMVPCA